MQKSRLVLVVDDAADLSDCICAYLTANNIECVVAYTGEQALQKFSNKVDVVMLDLIIPDMDGWEIAKRMHVICADNGWSLPIFILFSGVLIDKQSAEIHESGIDFVLQKPLYLSRVKKIIEEL